MRASSVRCSATFVIFACVLTTLLTVLGTSGNSGNNHDHTGTGMGESSAFRTRRSSSGGRMTRARPSSTPTPQTPVPSTDSGPSSARIWRGNKKDKALPHDASSRHPVTLLHEMLLDPKYQITHCSEDWKGVKVQSMKAQLTIPKLNRTFGPVYGRNKKQAKRRVAELAAQSLYNITFDDPTPMTDRHHDQHLTICNDPAREE